MNLLRTPDHRFESLPEYPFAPNYLSVNGMRIHYVEEGEGEPLLCLHGEPTWSYLYRHMITGLADQHRVIAPDFPGFGKSDKPARTGDYHYSLLLDTLQEFIEQKELWNINLAVHDWGGLIGLGLVGKMPERFSRLVIMNTALPSGKPLPLSFKLWQLYARYFPVFSPGLVLRIGSRLSFKRYKKVKKGYTTPFPGEKYKKGCRALPGMIPSPGQQQGLKEMKRAREVLKEWYRPVLIMFGKKDPVFPKGDAFFDRLIPDHPAKQVVPVKDAGHFLQEDQPELVTEEIKRFLSAF